ncbi:hypothetical protein ACO2Q8_06520 [Larkinella sp. VNQ87]|uniref:hypothetical protein n=1 Tax=Larkinella sp. VNQ87 TaxID=3400921 RepID=UPI003C10BE00
MVTENGQGKAEFYLDLERCCQRVSEVYGNPDWMAWTNSDYIRLSRILFRQTNVQISPNTLKRIFGKIKTDSRYYPQKATRDALASYVGYPDWERFVQAQKTVEVPIEKKVAMSVRPPLPVLVENRPEPSRTGRKGRFWASAGLALGVMALVVWLRQTVEPAGPVQLICRNPLGENPHSAVFSIQRPNPNSSESAVYVIQYGDGKRERIDPADSLHTHYYERPGRYFAILQRDGRNLDTATVYLRTKGWTATADMRHDTTRVYPVAVENLFVNGRWSVSPVELARAGIDTNRTFFVHFINSQPTTIDGDNFELTARIKTSPDRAGVRCSQVGLTVWGESSEHRFDVMKPGCVHWIELQTSEQWKRGQRDDLSFLGADLRAGGTLRLAVIDRRVRIFINNKPVYETRYTQPLRRIYGVRIQFAGVGTVESFALKDRKTGAVFNGNF